MSINYSSERFKMLQTLSQSGMATLSLAQSLENPERYVVVKGVVENLNLNEERTSVSMGSSKLVKMYDQGIDTGQVYLVLKEINCFEITQVVRIAEGFALGFASGEPGSSAVEIVPSKPAKIAPQTQATKVEYKTIEEIQDFVVNKGAQVPSTEPRKILKAIPNQPVRPKLPKNRRSRVDDFGTLMTVTVALLFIASLTFFWRSFSDGRVHATELETRLEASSSSVAQPAVLPPAPVSAEKPIVPTPKPHFEKSVAVKATKPVVKGPIKKVKAVAKKPVKPKNFRPGLDEILSRSPSRIGIAIKENKSQNAQAVEKSKSSKKRLPASEKPTS